MAAGAKGKEQGYGGKEQAGGVRPAACGPHGRPGGPAAAARLGQRAQLAPGPTRNSGARGGRAAWGAKPAWRRTFGPRADWRGLARARAERNQGCGRSRGRSQARRGRGRSQGGRSGGGGSAMPRPPQQRSTASAAPAASAPARAVDSAASTASTEFFPVTSVTAFHDGMACLRRRDLKARADIHSSPPVCVTRDSDRPGPVPRPERRGAVRRRIGAVTDLNRCGYRFESVRLSI